MRGLSLVSPIPEKPSDYMLVVQKLGEGAAVGGKQSADRRTVAATCKNSCGVQCTEAPKGPRVCPQQRHLSPGKAKELENPTCPEPAVARSSDSSPPSQPKASAEGSQKVTGPKLSAPKRDPPPGDQDARGRSLPFLSPPAQSSFIL